MSQLLSLFLGLMISLLCYPQSAQAADCTEYMKDFGNIHYYRLSFQPNRCFLDLSSVNVPSNMIYRSYLATNDGILMVFNSYGPGESSEMTGARVFYFFPRTALPDVVEKPKTLELQTASPLAKFEMSPTTADLISMNGGSIKVDPKVHDKNNGGVEILSHPGLILDVGFAVGHDPSEVKDHESIFEDATKKKCLVKNHEIFDYADNDVKLKFHTDPELAKFLKVRCPNLKF